MGTKKACVIHTPSKRAEAEVVAKKLTDDGFAVCIAVVTLKDAEAVKAGNVASLPSDVQDCLQDAEVCVILVDEEAALGGVGGIASDQGCRVVTVGGDPENLSPDLDDIIDGHVPSPDDPDLVDIVEGEPERIRPDQSPAPPRKPDTVKCQ